MSNEVKELQHVSWLMTSCVDNRLVVSTYEEEVISVLCLLPKMSQWLLHEPKNNRG